MKTIAQMAAETERVSVEERKEVARIDNAVTAVMKTETGRDILKEIIGYCDLYGVDVSATNHVYIHEGKRSIGLRIIELIGQHNYIRLIGE